MKGLGRRRLKGWRGDKDYTQSQMARRAGMGLNRYWQIENGEGPEPTKDEKDAVATALGVKVGDIQWPELGVKAS